MDAVHLHPVGHGLGLGGVAFASGHVGTGPEVQDNKRKDNAGHNGKHCKKSVGHTYDRLCEVGACTRGVYSLRA
jgi:hypothetical protein